MQLRFFGTGNPSLASAAPGDVSRDKVTVVIERCFSPKTTSRLKASAHMRFPYLC